MSVQRRERKKGVVFVVHYYDTDQRKYVNRTFFDPRKTERQNERDAEAFDAMVMLAKRRGDLDELDAGRETLKEFEQEWWTNYALLNLAAHTIRSYRPLIDKFILPKLGHHPLRKITPMLLTTYAARLDVPDPTKLRILAILQGIMERAVEWGRISTNPVKVVRKPDQRRQRTPRPLAPVEVEALRDRLSSDRDKTLASVLAYAGLRPAEALALRWEDIGERVINVERALALGEEKDTKNHRVRQVPMLSALKEDLLAWKLKSGRRSGLVFPDRKGEPWSHSMYESWRTRVFRKAAPEGLRVYDLRHSFASLMFAAGRNPAQIAEQTGHTLQTLLTTYVRVIEELRDAETVDPEALIRAARNSTGERGTEAGTAGSGTG